jgi:hypothetical protein
MSLTKLLSDVWNVVGCHRAGAFGPFFTRSFWNLMEGHMSPTEALERMQTVTASATAFGRVSHRSVKRVAFLLLAIVLSGVTAKSGTSAQPDTEVLPNSVELPPGGQITHVLVVFRNATDTDLLDVTLSWLNDEAVIISPAAPLHLARLAPHAETAWTLEFSQPGLDPVVGSVRLRIDYKEGSVTKIVAQSVALKSREPVQIDKYLDAKIQTTLETLDTYHPGKVNLLLTNKLGRQILLDIRAKGPDFICFSSDQKDCEAGAVAEGVGWMRRLASVFQRGAIPVGSVQSSSQAERHGVRIEPYQTHIEVFEVGARERVEPGKYLLAFEIFLSPSSAQSATRSVVKTQVVEVGVLAESAILKVMGVPSFLLLPGSILMLTVGLFWKVGSSRSASEAERLREAIDPTKGYFWLISITISGLMAVIFRVVFGWWYFVRYGLADVVFVWLASVIAGALIYTLIYWIELHRTPTEKDEPAELLMKLCWQREGLERDRYTIKDAENTESVFRVQKHREGEKNIWVSPSIKVTLSGLEDNLAERIRKQLGSEGKPGKLARLLRKAPKHATWSTRPIDCPKMLPIDQLKDAGRDNIVQETP